MAAKKKMISFDLLFYLLLLAYLLATLFLFHRQTVRHGGRYRSDIPPYLERVPVPLPWSLLPQSLPQRYGSFFSYAASLAVLAQNTMKKAQPPTVGYPMGDIQPAPPV